VLADPATHTAYIGNAGAIDSLPSSIGVLNAAICNASVTTGCHRRPPAIPIQFAPIGVAVNQATDTVYATNTFDSNGNPGTTVSVIDGATCNATVTIGCGDTPATATVGSRPSGLAVNQATNTIYVANQNGHRVGHQRRDLQRHTHLRLQPGSADGPARGHAGGDPAGLAVDLATHTVYAGDAFGGPVSFFQLPRRPTDVTATAHDGKAQLRWRPPTTAGCP